ncbi:DUF5947 family protein [Phytohabitans rumicis]|uniref:Uncharacterized protein n=1 Tax=Phytohabitans rumicis TaxID=1076125 RepID=A0A6V8LJ66_9ACTN|nr:DUF5947 family protein [Phytohabitans rumicis]GFJ94216.1 hypothetical protein Prum_078580 [Phytohabitans rumicis]
MTAGLRRFARPQAAPADLPRIGRRRRDETAESCEMCGASLPPDHGHVAEPQRRSLSCVCPGCYLLFTADGAGHGRRRAVPRRIHHDPATPLTLAEYDELGVPVAMAFFFRNSVLDRIVGCYPSPGGATECELDLAAWDRLAADHPLLAALEPDVEAVFVDRRPDAIEAHLIPIDACYGLIGQLRMRWTGFDGGDEVRRILADFRDDLRALSTPLPGRA